MKYIYFFLCFFCFISFTSCKKNKVSGNIVSLFKVSEMKQNYPDFEKDILSDSLRTFLTDTTAWIDNFYKDNDYEIIWAKDIFENPNLDSLMAYISRSEEHGLNPEIFNQKEMNGLLDSLKKKFFGNNMPLIYASLKRLEYLATKAYTDYITGMKYGFVDPKILFPNDYFINLQYPDSTHYEDLFNSLNKEPIVSIVASQPKEKNYLRLQSFLKKYTLLSDTLFEKISFKAGRKNLLLNQKDTILPLIAKRLMISGELSTEYADSIYLELTPELMAAINLFRINNSYPVNEELGESTIESLNRPFSYYQKTIKANLERARWKRITPASDKFVLVNVAAFNLQAFDSSYDPIKMNVCVGISVKNQTPLLESEISYINLNPKWNVPQSIIEKEIYWLVSKDSTYLRRHQMKVLTRGGESIDPSTINWRSLDPKRFPYLVRQESGSGNSLGRIKFMFDNPFSVYLHDTPMKSKFAAKNRAVSHGCVRVEKPMDLAFFCLAKKDSLYFDRIRYSIDLPPLSKEGKKELQQGKLKKVPDIINFEKKIPLFIDYYTVYFLPDDKPYFADDVYFFDKKICNALKIN